MAPELLSALCLLGLIVFGGFGLKWLREDMKRDAEVRAHIFRRMGG